MEYQLFILFALVILAGAEFRFSSSPYTSRSLQDIINKRKQLDFMKAWLKDLDGQLEKMQKRSCLYNFNLPGNDCEHGDIAGSGKDQEFWGSRLSPGKKRSNERILKYFL